MLAVFPFFHFPCVVSSFLHCILILKNTNKSSKIMEAAADEEEPLDLLEEDLIATLAPLASSRS